MKNRRHSKYTMQLFTALCLLLPLSIYAQQAAQIRVIEEEAIPFTRFLSKADFDQRYPGKLLSDAAKLDTGWYVIYQHESLNYYFGPMLLESTGQDYFEQFKETVGEAVDQRPSIEGYRLELSFEPQIATTNPSGSTPPQSGEPQIGSGTPQPAPKPSIFDFIKRIFGFG